ncbi:uncharacterized protein LOC105430033 [Pogonomyrmex barbatus]|uniref:Uncharacterized protein LOC105430033 n=1 Tax=Pogonomyrmex barbatus TaxID=144034 RepID=A0A6I9WPX2_9HYME|nr:uncharacterized protein LOC105430033 [Pogonomyrmex barbatus]
MFVVFVQVTRGIPRDFFLRKWNYVNGKTHVLKKLMFTRSKLDEPSTRRDGDDDGFSLVTVTSVSLQESTGSTFTGSVCTNWEEKFACRALQRRGRVFSYRKRKTHFGDGVFGAPTGVCPHRVTSSVIRRNTGDSRLVFIWPQKAGRSRLSNVLVPLLRGVLVGLLFVDALHLWPGEFLPTSLPSTMPITLPPVKCNVIEPRWYDNN